MITLKLNTNKMGMWSKGRNNEWYTAEVGKLGAIHVHDDTPDRQWTYRIHAYREIVSAETYDTKNDAFLAAVNSFRRLVKQASEELE